ncbi:MAG TPA: hypothetical protein VG097_09025 [Gemmata sp.]|jgi:hypothetical protein|nr:hypothetical protein [Gemmata sp.]
MSKEDDPDLQRQDELATAGLNGEHADDHCFPNPSTSGQQLFTPLARSQAAYIADLPELLQHHPEEWVAYADGKQLRFGKTQTELYRYCLNELGLTHDRFVVRLVLPESDPTIEYNLR